MKLQELTEATDQYVYHVTFSTNVKKIEQKGLMPLQTSNWKKEDGEGRYNEEGGVFAFEHPEDAFKWSFKQGFEFKKPISIIKLKRSDSWEVDPSQDINLQSGKGKALRSTTAIKSDAVVKSFNMDDFSNPSELKISQKEWIDGIVDKLGR